MNSNFNLAKQFVARKRKDNHESLSGPGSHIVNTTEIVDTLNTFIADNNIQSILDLGCGDWNWFKKINIQNAKYIGWDACDQMIADNSKFYGCANITFETKDIVTENYPYSDLIICRDVLFHMTTDLSMHILEKVKSSCKYFICTSFNDVPENIPHKRGWGFYKINTNIQPFNMEQYIISTTPEHRNNHSGYHRYINIYQINDT